MLHWLLLFLKGLLVRSREVGSHHFGRCSHRFSLRLFFPTATNNNLHSRFFSWFEAEDYQQTTMLAAVFRNLKEAKCTYTAKCIGFCVIGLYVACGCECRTISFWCTETGPCFEPLLLLCYCSVCAYVLTFVHASWFARKPPFSRSISGIPFLVTRSTPHEGGCVGLPNCIHWGNSVTISWARKR